MLVEKKVRNSWQEDVSMMRFIGCVITVLACVLLTGAAAGAKDTIVVNGSTTVLPIGQATAEAYMKKDANVNISISGGGSGNGIKALIDKTTQIAMSSREMKKEEIELAKSKKRQPRGAQGGHRRPDPYRASLEPCGEPHHRTALPHLPGQDPELEGSGRKGSSDRR